MKIVKKLFDNSDYPIIRYAIIRLFADRSCVVIWVTFCVCSIMCACEIEKTGMLELKNITFNLV